ncbi:FHA domain-containing protein FhaA [Corynebacterium kalinowskii]|uniref:FHA domain-containing protein FhaA n=1 Tax=Corynebacterium kalinowskii TaxID=2675216 RepID=A0A6B8VUK3_9CORY|nr:DUF3662 and FHA domain-containing protein [Corynebacterium kalinowskii]QGU00940.1 FHA domain-containing protein FhaA [Corynebacterium kalinowskii]
MGLMDRFAKLDSAMQRGLDNGLARVFGGNVVPAEIEEALKQQAEDYRVHTYEGYIEAPNEYTVSVSEQDAKNLKEQHPRLEEGLADLMTRHIRNQGWTAAGEVSVKIQANESLKTGQMKVENKIEEDMDVDKQPKHLNLLLQDGSSRTYALKEGSNIIGRGQDADLRLPDTGVSREHVEITWNGEDAVLTDLQSTNGTTVNDMPVDNWMLADGDVISVGHSRIEVRITKG